MFDSLEVSGTWINGFDHDGTWDAAEEADSAWTDPVLNPRWISGVGTTFGEADQPDPSWVNLVADRQWIPDGNGGATFDEAAEGQIDPDWHNPTFDGQHWIATGGQSFDETSDATGMVNPVADRQWIPDPNGGTTFSPGESIDPDWNSYSPDRQWQPNPAGGTVWDEADSPDPDWVNPIFNPHYHSDVTYGTHITQIEAHLQSTVAYGSLSLNLDGSFAYYPPANFLGLDTFTYYLTYLDDRIFDSAGNPIPQQTNIATVALNVLKLTVDIDTDSDNNGTLNRSQAEDDVEADTPNQTVDGRFMTVNDNDSDGNGNSDLSDSNLAVADPDLIEIVLNANTAGATPAQLAGYSLRIEVSQGANLIKLWDSSKKINQIQFGQTWAAGTTQHIWVEGQALGFAVLDGVLLGPAGEVDRDKIKLTIKGISKVEFVVTNAPGYGELLPGQNPDGTGAANDTPAFMGGDQFFPDAQDFTSRTQANNIVRVRASVDGVKVGDIVYFRAYDVDDPSPDRVIDPNGDGAANGNDNRGQLAGLDLQNDNADGGRPANSRAPTAGGFQGHLRPIKADGTPGKWNVEGAVVVAVVRQDAGGLFAEVDLATSFAPGDNFRVGASLYSSTIANVNALDTKTVYKTMTPQLSVWRYFNIELDSMALTDGDMQTGLVKNQATQLGAFGNQYDIQLTGLGTINRIMTRDEYKDGILRLNGVNYRILGNDIGPEPVISIEIIGASNVTSLTAPQIVGSDVELFQDDWTAVGNDPPHTRASTMDTNHLLDFLQESTNRAANRYADAYLIPRRSTLLEFTSEVASKQHANITLETTLADSVSRDNSQQNGHATSAPGYETNTFWVVYIVTAYEAGIDQDGDGQSDSLVRGASAYLTERGLSAIFIEPAYETAQNSGLPADEVLARVTAHEVGHQFLFKGNMPNTGGHRDDGQNIMSSNTAATPAGSYFFNPAEIGIMRSRRVSPGMPE